MGTKINDFFSETCELCNRVRPIVVFFLYIIVICFSVYGIYLLQLWWKDNSPSVSFGQGSIVPIEAHPGDKMIAYLTVNKLRDCSGTVYQVATGECGYHVLSHSETTFNKGFSGRVTMPFQLPYEAIPGNCSFRVYARYMCNPFDWFLQRQVFESNPIPFKVIGYDQ